MANDMNNNLSWSDPEPVFRALSGSAFDKAFMQGQVETLLNTLGLYPQKLLLQGSVITVESTF